MRTHPLATFFQQECCGTSGPMDWVNYTSAFRAATPEVVFPWPPLCCRRTGNFIPINEDGCRVGHMDYLFTKVCLFCPLFSPFLPYTACLSHCLLASPLWPFLSFPSPWSSQLFVWILRTHRCADSDRMSAAGWLGMREATGMLSVAGARPRVRACHPAHVVS